MTFACRLPRIFCHRGFYGVTDSTSQANDDAKGPGLKEAPPENSELSIRTAFEKKLAVELDVTMTKDRELVITHTNDLTFHSLEAQPGDRVSEKTLRELSQMKTGLGGQTAPFMTFAQLIDLLFEFPSAIANIEIKGTIQAELLAELKDPSLIERLVALTPSVLLGRIIWSSFANSNIMAFKEAVPHASIAQLFAEPARVEDIVLPDLVYPDRSDTYLQFTPANLAWLDSRIESVHPSLDSLGGQPGLEAIVQCAEKGLHVRTWALNEKDPFKNPKAHGDIVSAVELLFSYPKLKLDFITNFPEQVALLVGRLFDNK
jgi:glycerophosphoryl diester phosphodiesterase